MIINSCSQRILSKPTEMFAIAVTTTPRDAVADVDDVPPTLQPMSPYSGERRNKKKPTEVFAPRVTPP